VSAKGTAHTSGARAERGQAAQQAVEHPRPRHLAGVLAGQEVDPRPLRVRLAGVVGHPQQRPAAAADADGVQAQGAGGLAQQAFEVARAVGLAQRHLDHRGGVGQGPAHRLAAVGAGRHRARPQPGPGAAVAAHRRTQGAAVARPQQQAGIAQFQQRRRRLVGEPAQAQAEPQRLGRAARVGGDACQRNAAGAGEGGGAGVGAREVGVDVPAHAGILAGGRGAG
jgi:hypothetical protein